MNDVNESAIKEIEIESEDASMTEWTNEPKLSDLKMNYSDSHADKSSHISRVDGWLDKMHIRNGAKLKPSKTRSTVQPKLIRKQAEWRYPALSEPFLSTEDIFTASPVTYEDKKAAIQNQLLLNNQFNTQIDKVEFIDEYVRTAVDEGTVIVRVGWDTIEEEREVEVPVFTIRQSNNPEMVEVHRELYALSQSDPEGFAENVPPEMQRAHELTVKNGVPMEPIQTGTKLETEKYIAVNQPTLDICEYTSISIDPSAKGNLKKAGFIVYDFETSLSELRKHKGRYSNLDQIDTNTGSILAAEDNDSDTSNSSFSFKDEPRKVLLAHEYWGYWDYNGTGIVKPFVATWIGNTLIRMESNPYPDKDLPFVKVQYLPVRKSSYGEPDGELLADNQNVTGAVTRGMVDLLGRSANGQVGSRKDALDVSNKRKFEQGRDYEFNPSIGSPENAFYMHKFPEIPRSAEYMLTQQNNDAESLTGVNAFGGSGLNAGSLGDSVGGIKSTLSAASKREIGILRRLSSGLIKIGRKMISMNAQFLSEEEVVRVSNEEFVPVRRDDLEGKIDLKLAISTPEHDNEKAQELSFMLQTTGQTMGAAFSQIILADIARLRKMPELEKRIKEFKPEPDPIAQRKAQLEIELLEAQIANERSKAVENQAEARLSLAKESTEVAKKGNLESDTDLKNLTFVEQETGTNQERDKELAQINAQANRELKVLDSLLKPTPEGTTNNRDNVTVSNGLKAQ